MFSLQSLKGTKQEQYDMLDQQLQALLTDEKNWLANLANTASLLYFSLQNINWSGFYLLQKQELVLGPFMGKPACVRIPVGKGVCGTAVAEQKTIVVKDVHQFPGHIACDADSRSEIVIPLKKEGEILGVLDIDSPIANRFDQTDQERLEKLVKCLIEACDWPDETA